MTILVDATQKLNDQFIIIQGLTGVAQGVGDGLEASAEDGDGGIPLASLGELRLEMESPCPMVVDEESLEEAQV